MLQVQLLAAETLALREIAQPVPHERELVVEVVAALTCGTDLKVWRRGGHPRMLVLPSPFGHELCGRVVAVGEGVEDWPIGTPVVCANSAPCGSCGRCLAGRDNLCQSMKYLNGAFAEQILIPADFVERSLRRSPVGVAPELAALAEPLACVSHGIAALRPQPGETIAVLGCGPIGLLFVAELAHLGARAVALDPNPARLAIARQLGAVAAEAVDREQPFSPLPLDAVVEATGSPSAWAGAPSLVGPGGRVLFFGGVPPGQVLSVDAERLHYEELTLLGAYHYTRRAFDHSLARLTTDGERLRPLLSSTCDLTGVADALERMAAREVLKVVVRPKPEAGSRESGIGNR